MSRFLLMLLACLNLPLPSFLLAEPEAKLPASSPLEVSGFSWAENLAFDGLGNLFVSDTETGQIFRVYWGGSSWEKALFFSEATSVNGLAVREGWLYACRTSLEGEHQVIRISLQNPGAAPEVLGRIKYFGNGLEFDDAGNLYITTEGNFLPSTGTVYKLTPGGTLAPFVSGIWGADGIAIDSAGGHLYVSQVVNNKLVDIELATGKILRVLSVAKVGSLLDDIALDASAQVVYGADFGKGRILRIPLDGSTPTVVAEGLQAPTSLLFGKGPGFDPQHLYVTEGGGLLEKDADQRVLELQSVL